MNIKTIQACHGMLVYIHDALFYTPFCLPWRGRKIIKPSKINIYTLQLLPTYNSGLEKMLPKTRRLGFVEPLLSPPPVCLVLP